MAFQTKKIKIETLADYLASVRQQRGLSIEGVAVKSKTNGKYILALEKGDFAGLPPEVYVLALLSRMAKVYEIPLEEVKQQYIKERQVYENIEKGGVKKAGKLKIFFSNLIITPKFLKFFVSLAVLFVVLIYVVWQVFSINKSPELQIFEPQNNSLVEGSFVLVKGQTESGVNLKVNEKIVFVGSDGFFEVKLGLNEGPAEIKLEVTNKFGKSLLKTLRVTGKSAKVSQAKITITMEFNSSADIDYFIDNQEKISQHFGFGETKTLYGYEKISLNISDGGAVRLFFNGQDLGVMGKEGEVLQNVVFYPESSNPLLQMQK